MTYLEVRRGWQILLHHSKDIPSRHPSRSGTKLYLFFQQQGVIRKLFTRREAIDAEAKHLMHTDSIFNEIFRVGACPHYVMSAGNVLKSV